MIVIIDYHMGNLRSVEKAVEWVGGEVIVSNDVDVIEEADKIILPGVGAFPNGMKNLMELGLVDVLKKQILVHHKPFLGICLGMQLLAKKSYEFGECIGLGLIDAEVVKFSFADQSLRVPHVGWSDICVLKESPFLDGIQTGDDFYFVHSYHMKNNNPKDVVATCRYGFEFTAAIQKDNMFATQFHPEKSQEKGLRLLSQFVMLGSKVNA